MTVMKERGFLTGAKGRRRAGESVYPQPWKQQHKVNWESCCRAKEASTLWIREKGKPLANAQVELWGILLNHHKSLAALPGFSFVPQRLHSRWLLCFIQQKCTNPLWISHSYTLSQTHILLFPVWAAAKAASQSFWIVWRQNMSFV